MFKKSIYLTLAACAITAASFASQEKPKPPLFALFQTHAIESSLKLDESIDVAPLLALLDQVRPTLEGVVPTEADFAFVVSYLQPFLEQLENADEASFQEVINQSFQMLSQFFTSAEFTPEQKAALFSTLESFALNLSQ